MLCTKLVFLLIFYMIANETINEKELLREEFELIASNIKSILSKRKDKITAYDRDFILNAIKVMH